MNASAVKTLLVTGGAFVLTISLQAADGVLVVSKTTTGTNTRTSQVQIERTRMRTETSDPSGTGQTVVFDGVKQAMYIIYPDRKTYSEMTQADVDKLAEQAQGAMAQMNAAMANMTPAQRAQMEAMMGGRGLPTAPPKTVFRKTGTDKVGRWTCDKYEGYLGATKIREVCTVEPSALGFALADFAVTRQMADFFAKLVPQSGAQMLRIAPPEEQGYSGIPIRQVSFADGQPSTSTEITEVSKQTFPDSVFAIPAGFQKTDFLGGLGARGRGRGRGERY